MSDTVGRAEEIKDGDHDWFFDIIINFLRSFHPSQNHSNTVLDSIKT